MTFLTDGRFPHIHKTIVASTNTDLMTAILSNQLPKDLPYLMTADRQNQGKGQHNRSWVSPIGNVYLSLYIPATPNHHKVSLPPTLYRLTGALSLLVGYHLWQMPIIQAINQARCDKHLATIQVKWANDLGMSFDPTHTITANSRTSATAHMFCHFVKLAGILIEPVIKDTLLGVIIGVGLNVAYAPKIADGLYQTTCLHALLDDTDAHHPIAHELYAPITDALLTAIDQHNQCTRPYGHNITLTDNFIHAFNNAHALHGKLCGIYTQDEMNHPSDVGICTGIGADGTLLLDTPTGQKAIFSGTPRLLV